MRYLSILSLINGIRKMHQRIEGR